MPVTVKVNGVFNSLVHKGSNGISMATIPDVCKTPAPGGPVPIPYPNISQSAMLAKGTTTVKADGGMMIAIKGSEFSISSGDEPGVAGGVVSGVNMKESTWILYSFDVKMDGQNACRFMDKKFQNHQNTVDMAGEMQAPVVVVPASGPGVLQSKNTQLQSAVGADFLQPASGSDSLESNVAITPPEPAGPAFGYQPAKKSALIDYGYWCGPENAPLIYDASHKPRPPSDGAPPGLEGAIDPDPGKWDNDYLAKLKLPIPMDGLDHVCMIHDMKLGAARQKRGMTRAQLKASSGDAEIADINREALSGFVRYSDSPDVWAAGYARRAATVFVAQWGGNVGKIAYKQGQAAIAAKISAVETVVGKTVDGAGQALQDAWNYVLGN